MPGEEERETFGVDSLADDCVGDIGAVDHEGGVLAPPFDKRQTIRNPYIYIHSRFNHFFSLQMRLLQRTYCNLLLPAYSKRGVINSFYASPHTGVNGVSVLCKSQIIVKRAARNY